MISFINFNLLKEKRASNGWGDSVIGIAGTEPGVIR